MFSKIMMPVDLAHMDRMEKAKRLAFDLAKDHGATVTLVGVTSSQPSALGRTPEEFGAKLGQVAEDMGKTHGVATDIHVIHSPDPTAELDQALLQAVKDTGADLVVMASHIPGVKDYLWSGHGAHMAAHAKASVMLIRG